MVRAIICGVNGKMGQVVAECIAKTDGIAVMAGVDKFPRIRENPFPVYGNIFECEIGADVIVDFSRPEALSGNLTYASLKEMAIVIATTGFSNDDMATIRSYSDKIAMFMSANMSLGVNLQIELIKKAAEFLGHAYDIEIIEKHHNQKVDSPSGTALALADSINSAFATPLDYVYGRHSKSEKRSDHEIGIHAIRGGTLVGEHLVSFIGTDEVIEINHMALSKQIFATGAIRAAKFIHGRPAGLYCMNDIITEQNTITNFYSDDNQSIITINNVPHSPKLIANIFNALAGQNINIDIISQTSPVDGNVDISFSLNQENLDKAVNTINSIKKQEPGMTAEIIAGVSKLTVEGIGMQRQSGVAAKVFHAFALAGIKIKIITTSETKITMCIDNTEKDIAIKTISSMFGI
jgi:4-hydroxy-tetrahydrodipicolinate reductase